MNSDVSSTNMAEIDFNIEVYSLDFIGAVAGKDLVIGFVMEIASSGLFIIRTMSLFVERNYDVKRTPYIEYEFKKAKVYETEEL